MSTHTETTTRTITVAIDSDCALGGEPLIWGAVEGDDTDAAVANARECIAEGGELSPASVRRRAEGLDVVTIRWEGALPNGDNAAAIALALAALGAPAVETEATYSVTFRGAATVDAYSATEGADDNDALTLTETRERCEAYGVSAELRDSAGFGKGFVSADGSYTLA